MRKANRLIFLDRDGVINRFPGFGRYVTRWAEFRFLPHSVKAIAALTRAGYHIAVVSNQGCVARGLITSEGLRALTDRMRRRIERSGGRLDEVYYCEHRASQNCSCKKPKTALFLRALKKRKAADVRNIFFIGDSAEDMEAGRRLGCRTILVLSGRLKKKDVPDLTHPPDSVKKNLWEAVRWILRKKS